MKPKHIISCILITLLSFYSCKKKNDPNNEVAQSKKEFDIYPWKQYRGVNISCEINEEDIQFLAQSGANLMRLSTPICTFMELKAPYQFNKNAFKKLDSILDWGEKYGVAVLIDPHRYPGTTHKWTMLGNDPFWKNFKYHDLVIKVWDSIATQCSNRGKVIAGYDLLNEPEVPVDMQKGTPHDINLLYKKITKTIRKKDSVHTIVYALPRVYDREKDELYGYHKGITLFEIPDDTNICIETHTYMPHSFTHQNIWREGEYIPYPTEVEGKLWDATYLEEVQTELIEFSKKYSNIPVLVGEFSSPRWTGEDGIRYLTDVIEIAEKYNWSWSYHAFRENQVWDPEMSITDRNDSIRVPNAPRWELLKSYFSKNNSKE